MGDVSWSSKLQEFVALVTTEAKYVSNEEVVVIKDWSMDGEYVVYYDSQSEMDIKKTPCTTLIQMILMWDTIGQKKRLKVNTKYIQPMKIHTLCVCWKGGS